MAAPATKKVSKFSVLKAATPQGAKRSVNEIAVRGAAPEIPKASKVDRYRAPPPYRHPYVPQGRPFVLWTQGTVRLGPFSRVEMKLNVSAGDPHGHGTPCADAAPLAGVRARPRLPFQSDGQCMAKNVAAFPRALCSVAPPRQLATP
jgi:hypothetical protein